MSDSLPTDEDVPCHYIVLEFFWKLLYYVDKDPGLGPRTNAHGLSPLKGRRFQNFIAIAAYRYEQYLDCCLKAIDRATISRHTLNSDFLSCCPLPPWDVAIVFYIHLLSPSHFVADIAHGSRYAPLWDANIHLPMMRLAILREAGMWTDEGSERIWQDYCDQASPYQLWPRDPTLEATAIAKLSFWVQSPWNGLHLSTRQQYTHFACDDGQTSWHIGKGYFTRHECGVSRFRDHMRAFTLDGARSGMKMRSERSDQNISNYQYLSNAIKGFKELILAESDLLDMIKDSKYDTFWIEILQAARDTQFVRDSASDSVKSLMTTCSSYIADHRGIFSIDFGLFASQIFAGLSAPGMDKKLEKISIADADISPKFLKELLTCKSPAAWERMIADKENATSIFTWQLCLLAPREFQQYEDSIGLESVELHQHWKLVLIFKCFFNENGDPRKIDVNTKSIFSYFVTEPTESGLELLSWKLYEDILLRSVDTETRNFLNALDSFVPKNEREIEQIMCVIMKKYAACVSVKEGVDTTCIRFDSAELIGSPELFCLRYSKLGGKCSAVMLRCFLSEVFAVPVNEDLVLTNSFWADCSNIAKTIGMDYAHKITFENILAFVSRRDRVRYSLMSNFTGNDPQSYEKHESSQLRELLWQGTEKKEIKLADFRGTNCRGRSSAFSAASTVFGSASTFHSPNVATHVNTPESGKSSSALTQSLRRILQSPRK